MKAKYTYITICIALMTLASCHEEEIFTGPCDVHFRAYLQDELSVTRASYTAVGDDVPAFTAELFVSNGQLANRSSLTWNGKEIISSIRLEEGTYTLYGYAPQQEGASLDPVGKTMTIPALSGLGGKDALVISPQTLEILPSDKEKNVTLQLDHLLARVTPYIYVHEKYAEMRTIKIKKVEMVFPNDTLYTAVVNVDDNDDDGNYNVAWNKGDATTESIATTYETADPEALTTIKGEQGYGSCYLCPAKWTGGLRLRVTYDVYDTVGSLTRKDAVVENLIKRLPASLTAGINYKLHIKIVPTYLYALSDNDNGAEIFIVDKN